MSQAVDNERLSQGKPSSKRAPCGIGPGLRRIHNLAGGRSFPHALMFTSIRPLTEVGFESISQIYSDIERYLLTTSPHIGSNRPEGTGVPSTVGRLHTPVDCFRIRRKPGSTVGKTERPHRASFQSDCAAMPSRQAPVTQHYSVRAAARLWQTASPAGPFAEKSSIRQRSLPRSCRRKNATLRPWPGEAQFGKRP